MSETATALAQAISALKETGRDHKRAAGFHRKAARDALRRAAFLESLTQIGIKVQLPEEGTDGTT